MAVEQNWRELIDFGGADRLDDLDVFWALTGDPGRIWFGADMVSERSGVAPGHVRAVLDRHIESGLIVRHPDDPDFYAERDTARPSLRLLARLPRHRAVRARSCATIGHLSQSARLPG